MDHFFLLAMKSPTAAAVSAGVIILTVISVGAVSWTQDYHGGWFKCDLTLHTAARGGSYTSVQRSYK